MARGGARPGAGRPKGSRNKTTIERVLGKTLTLEVLSNDELTNLCRDQAPMIVEELCKIVRDKRAAGSARVGAARAVLELAYGRPRQRPAPKPPEDPWASAKLIQPGDTDFEMPDLEAELLQLEDQSQGSGANGSGATHAKAA